MTNENDPDAVMAQAWRDNQAAEQAGAQPGGPHSTQPPSTNPAGATATATPPANPAADYADAWNRHSPLDDSPSMDNASSNWGDVKKAHPVVALVMSATPLVGAVTGAAEMNDAIHHHDKAGVVKAAAGMVPGGALLATGANAVRAGKAAADATKVASGAVRAATGAGAMATGTAAKLDDFAHAWNAHK